MLTEVSVWSRNQSRRKASKSNSDFSVIVSPWSLARVSTIDDMRMLSSSGHTMIRWEGGGEEEEEGGEEGGRRGRRGRRGEGRRRRGEGRRRREKEEGGGEKEEGGGEEEGEGEEEEGEEGEEGEEEEGGREREEERGSRKKEGGGGGGGEGGLRRRRRRGRRREEERGSRKEGREKRSTLNVSSLPHQLSIALLPLSHSLFSHYTTYHNYISDKLCVVASHVAKVVVLNYHLVLPQKGWEKEE